MYPNFLYFMWIVLFLIVTCLVSTKKRSCVQISIMCNQKKKALFGG